jgi:hypothetical protein
LETSGDNWPIKGFIDITFITRNKKSGNTKNIVSYNKIDDLKQGKGIFSKHIDIKALKVKYLSR